MRRQLILVLVVFILVTATSIAVIWTKVIPKYQAKAEVRVRPIIPYLVFKTEDSGMIPLYDSFVNTQVAIIRGTTVCQRILDRTDVRETQWYKNPKKSFVERLRGNPSASDIERLRDNLSVRPRSRTEIIDVSFVDPSVKDAKIIVNAVLEEYIKYIAEKSDEDENKLYHQLTDQYTSLQTQIQGQETTIAALRKSLGAENPQELIASKRTRLDQTQVRFGELRQRIALLEWEARQVITGDSNMVTADGMIEKQPKYHVDAEWRERDVEVRTIRHHIEASDLEPSNPDIIRAQKDLNFAEELLKLRETQLDEQWLDRPKNVDRTPIPITDGSDPNYTKALIKHRLERAKQEEKLLSEQYNSQQRKFKELFTNAQLWERENNSLQHKRELFDVVCNRLDQKRMERDASTGSIEVLMRAFASSEPYNDRRIMFTAIALILGLGFGVGTSFLFRWREGSVKN
jgi:uncharacterized protein involved in exopolysaccharide biosynthesis